MDRSASLRVFSERLCTAMNVLGLSSGDLQRLLLVQEDERVWPQSISQWRKGHCLPQRRRLRALARVLNTTVAFLMGEERYISPPPALPEGYGNERNVVNGEQPAGTPAAEQAEEETPLPSVQPGVPDG